MSNRYDDRDDERRRRNYGGGSSGEYDRSYNQSGQSGYRRDREDEGERYSGESRMRGQYGGGRNPYRSGSDYQSSSREDYGNEGWEGDYGNRGYGSAVPGRSYGDYGLGYGGIQGGYGRGERGFGSSGLGFSGAEGGYSSGERGQRYNYPTGYRSRERYGERGRDYDYGRGEYGAGQERGWWDRASDEVASWFGDEEAERRRRMDEQRPYRGKGPKGYRRSDERIKEDVNDRLSEGYIDASEITVAVENGEVTLSGTVNSRSDKRRAEDIAEYVSGVSNVENRLRVKDSYSSWQNTGTTGTSSTGADTTATGTDTGATRTGTGTSATGTSSSSGSAARGRTAGS